MFSRVVPRSEEKAQPQPHRHLQQPRPAKPGRTQASIAQDPTDLTFQIAEAARHVADEALNIATQAVAQLEAQDAPKVAELQRVLMDYITMLTKRVTETETELVSAFSRMRTSNMLLCTRVESLEAEMAVLRSAAAGGAQPVLAPWAQGRRNAVNARSSRLHLG